MSEMKNECREYAKRIAEEAETYYNGITNEDGEEASLYDYVADALDYEVILSSQKTVKMEVCIVNTIERLKDGKGWQIMKRAGTGYNHVFPGALYTVEEAANICNDNNFHVVAIGDFWECLKK